MSCRIIIDDRQEECKINLVKDILDILIHEDDTVKIDIKDIIAIEQDTASSNEIKSCMTVHYIQKKNSPRWRKESIKLTSEDDLSEKIFRHLKESVNKEISTYRPKKLFVIINPIGGEQNGETIFADLVKPMFDLAGIQTDVIISTHHKHVEEITKCTDFTPYDGIVAVGGDGTYYECMHVLLRRIQDEAGIDYNNPETSLKSPSIPLCLIPTGSGNVIAQIAHGCADVETSTLHLIRGRVKHMGVSGVYSDGKCLGFSGLLIAFGWWSEMLTYMENYRWLKVQRYRYVPIYFCLMKRRHLFNAEIEFTTSPCYDKQTGVVRSTGKDNETERFDGRIHGLIYNNGDFLTKNNEFGLKPLDYKSNLLSVFTETGRRNLMNYHIEMVFNRNTNTFQKDYVMIKKIRDFKIKINPVPGADSFFSTIAPFPNRIMLDGEYVYTTNREWEVRYLGEIMPVFCSLDEFGNLKL